MKKINVIVVGLLCLSLLTGCTTHKIERSQQDIEQEKVEKIKKEIASESKKKKASSTNLVIANSNESTQAESTQTESTQAESPQAESPQTESPEETYSTTPTTESDRHANCCSHDSCVAETNRLQEEYKNDQNKENTSTYYTMASQQGYPISCAPAWWRECISNGHNVKQGLNTQNGKYCWCCIECNKEVSYEICNDHNTPATPEHMQLHLN